MRSFKLAHRSQHKSPPVASAACFQLRLFTQCTDDILKILPDVAPRVLEVIDVCLLCFLHLTQTWRLTNFYRNAVDDLKFLKELFRLV